MCAVCVCTHLLHGNSVTHGKIALEQDYYGRLTSLTCSFRTLWGDKRGEENSIVVEVVTSTSAAAEKKNTKVILLG